MSISVKGRLAIVALIALACFAGSVLKLYLGLLCISLLLSFAVVGVVAWLVERLARKRHRGPERRRGRRRRCPSLIDGSQQLSMTTVDRPDAPTAAGSL
ncbi:hypothetical protein SSBR45G_63600 [Bradyrhizobium sp. SSBR45G]|uniref:hypothetical protein n=1 Tax=unclassified Bradyrhizobium TaxID=2631580 RepID=UPI002342AA6D|nr:MULTISPECIES: hypothetical protein [unclassified Bradyrhizobium]GLH81451.1 hypothetical protein SSBR45G_63600 [Bradyrhizobium sp. SSBR45G]GLH88858.1 hypothetical protein SSBR45R_63190 [Bradyrhizobium sp. SSBR45R]